MYTNLLQIFTRVYLEEWSVSLGRKALLADIPNCVLDEWAESGFDVLWLLGIWQTGEFGKQVSGSVPTWQDAFRKSLPDLVEDDICGSPFAITSYTADAQFGGPEGLANFRKRLSQRGIKLWLDFVPNHTAIDHPWVFHHPEFFIFGTEDDLQNEPQNYMRVETNNGPAIMAHGRDPYFPGWPDTLQLNYRRSDVKQVMQQELFNIAQLCDGVRCDMAMLLLPEIFVNTWGDKANSRNLPADDSPFWPTTISRARESNPKFSLMAEVYWGLEAQLMNQGFDFAYDKHLYDTLRSQNALAVRQHLESGLEFQNRLVRFLENHDEDRAAAVFDSEVHQAAAVICYLTPGLRFFYEGQFAGRRHHASVHLARRHPEPVAPANKAFYRRLLDCLKQPELRYGNWELLECRPAWEGNPTCEQFIAFTWQTETDRTLVVVNFGATRGQCFVELVVNEWENRQVQLTDMLGPEQYQRDGFELLEKGLYLDLPPWGYHAFRCELL